MVETMREIQNPWNFETSLNIENLYKMLVKQFETLVFDYENKGIHKLALYCVAKTHGDLFMELQQFRFAVKIYKALKNLCKKWQGEMF